MTVRVATLADVPTLVRMGCAQLTALYPMVAAPDPDRVTAFLTALVTGEASVVFVADAGGAVVGMIGLVRSPHPYAGVVTASELMWWMDPAARGGGVALLRRAERWALETGATHLQMAAPVTDARVGRFYQRRGYQPLEAHYQAPVTPAMSAITVLDDVLPDLDAYRAATRAQPFRTYAPVPDVAFHGIAAAVDDSLPGWLAARYPSLTPTLSFVRQSPEGQDEPHYIHTDLDMGQWTAIAYLTDAPAAGDGTTFWRWRETGCVQSVALGADAERAEGAAWRDLAQWEPWTTVEARPGRVVLFPAGYFHSRALPANYGAGDTARLIQVVFGTGAVPPDGGILPCPM
jgi:GNAT superfamily N-acetyltransferase